MRTMRFATVAVPPVASFMLLMGLGLFLSGCGCGSDPYEELNAQFPEGRPGVLGVNERMADPVYKENLQKGAMSYLSLAGDAATLREQLEARKAEIEASLKAAGATPTEAELNAALAQDTTYVNLQQALADADAKAEAQRLANAELIRQKAFEAQKKYDTLRAEADAKAAAQQQK